MNYIVNGTPKMCSMMDLIEAYVNHQIKVLIAATEFDKAKAEARKHILEGLILSISPFLFIIFLKLLIENSKEI